MNRRYTLISLIAWATMAFAQQPNPRLSQLDDYLQKQKGNVNVDSIRHIFASVSKEASDSYRYESHKGGADTIKYELAFRYDGNGDHRSPIREVARFLCSGTQGEYYHGRKNLMSDNEMKAIEVSPLTVSKQMVAPLSGQGQNPRLRQLASPSSVTTRPSSSELGRLSLLRQLEDYLQEQGLIKMVDRKPSASKTKKRHNKGGQLTTPPKQAVIDSIRTVFTDLSKEAMESHQYENHDDGTDTIEYALVFSDTEAVNFTYKKNAANQAKGLYTHTYEREEVKTSDAIAAKQWRIDIRSMNTMRYGSRMVTPDFYLELRGDTLCSYLPYLGQARVSPMFSPAIGLNFEKPVLSYKESQPKSKKYTQIDIDVKTQEDTYHYVIQLYDSGEAYIRVRSMNRDAISFDGTLVTSN